MRITRVRIENFRSIKNLDIELGDTTVLIGQNNSGKTAILDAVRIALTRRWGQRGTGFTEYDVHLATEIDDPKASSGVEIELRADEQVAGDWPEALQQGLDEIVQTDPATGRSFVSLRVTCAWVASEGCFQPYAVGRRVRASPQPRAVLAVYARVLPRCTSGRRGRILFKIAVLGPFA
jgi:putative ATP-dependent endonuclease of the OLD family